MGSKGGGEIGIVGSPAVANAVYHATGIPVRDLPITPDKLLQWAPGTPKAPRG
jgi:xanthine dehydrogenase YagR molybdenum-binding subunit